MSSKKKISSPSTLSPRQSGATRAPESCKARMSATPHAQMVSIVTSLRFREYSITYDPIIDCDGNTDLS